MKEKDRRYSLAVARGLNFAISEAIQRNKAIKEANIESINDYFISKWNSIFLVINKTTDEFKSQ